MSQTKKSETIRNLKNVIPMKVTTKNKEYAASDDVVAELNTTDVMYSSFKNLLANMIETHSKDGSDSLTKAPIFLGLIESAAENYKDFEKAKYTLEDELPVDDGHMIIEWNCDYVTHKVTYEIIKESNDTKSKKISVPEEICDKVWDAQLKHQVVSDVISWLNDTHANDKKDVITSSPVFKGFVLLKARLLDDFSKAKDEMYNSVVPVEDKGKFSNWTLSYKTGELTLTE